MASKQVMSKCKPLLNSKLETTNLPAVQSLLPKSNQPFLVKWSSEMAQATTISPTAVHSPGGGPCRAPTLTCPPPPCACPPPPQAVSLGKRIIRVIWFLTKLGLFVAVWKFTVDEGLWGDGAATEDLAKRMCIVSEEGVKTEKDAEKEKPKKSIVCMWDNMVVKAGGFIGLEP